jgi:eukaryotic-like serine/threonine-protein kinase
MSYESNLLLAVLALQADQIDSFQFWEALRQWTAHPDQSLVDILVERKWMSRDDNRSVQRWFERKLQKHGSARAALAACPGEEIPLLLEHLDDPGALASAFDHTARIPLEPAQDLAAVAAHVLVSSSCFHPATQDCYERYTLTSLHATGGVGRVWLARDAGLGRNVALKELRPELAENPEVWSRFLQEARTTGQLEHPGIVPVYELTSRTNDRQPFYTMRFVEGRTLSEAVDAYHKKRAKGEAGGLDLRTLLSALVSVCNAVGYAHSRGVVHRDLKGRNVVLGDFGEVMVLDWGLAKKLSPSPASCLLAAADGGDDPAGQPESAAGDECDASAPGDCETRAGQLLGTPAYMAPEQAAGLPDRVGPRTDVYGLGAILYEILTGRAPYSGKTVKEILDKVRRGALSPPLRGGGAGTPALEAICLTAMATRAEDRYASARDLADDVERWLADEPVKAYREPLPARLARWARRHRPVVAGAMTLLATAVIALTVGLVVLRAEKQRTELARSDAIAYSLNADAQRQRADANFARAREIVDGMVRRAGDTPVIDTPREDSIGDDSSQQHKPGSGGGRQYRMRRALLNDALTFYQGFLNQENNDPTVRREIGHAYQKIGDIYGVLNNEAEAKRAYAAAEAIQDARPQ